MNRKPSGGERETVSSRGSIICTASNAGLYPLPVAPLYATSKFAVVGLVRSLAKVLERSKIQINALAPAVLGEYGLFSSFFWKQKHYMHTHTVSQIQISPRTRASSGAWSSRPCRL